MVTPISAHRSSAAPRSASANWRQKDPMSATTYSATFGSPSTHGTPQSASFVQMQAQAEMYKFQQTQMALQLEAMKLQNLEMQERIMAAAAAYQPEPQQKRMSGYFDPATVNAVPSNYVNPTALNQSLPNQPSPSPPLRDHRARVMRSASPEVFIRRDALQSLQKAQNRRSADFSHLGVQAQAALDANDNKQQHRLSYTEGLAARAMARKTSAPSIPPLNEFNAHRQHRSSASMSSTSSAQSLVLNESHKQLDTPQGPTLVLSSPGEAFPSPSLGRHKLIKALDMHVKQANDSASDDSSSAPDTPSDVPESFLSHRMDMSGARSSASAAINPILNPSAPAFEPGLVSQAPPTSTPPSRSQSPHVQLFMHSRSVSSASSSAANPLMAVATRQPRGPPTEDERSSHNFKRRGRQADFANSVRSKLRTSWLNGMPVDAVAA